MSVAAPRIMISAASSGSGKTTVSCGLLRAFVRRGLKVRAFKSGPDYIDPMFHTQVIGVPSRNLDLFLGSAELSRSLVADGSRDCDITVLEGAMGFYDGISARSDASAWDLARVTSTPVVLTVDARGMSRSVSAEVLGFLSLEEPSMIAAVVLNRVSRSLYLMLREIIERDCGIPVAGYLPNMESVELESRHLGLVTAEEVEGLQGKLDELAAQAEETIDIDLLLSLADDAPRLDEPPALITAGIDLPRSGRQPRIAIARDAAFCFYYADSLRMLEFLGAELVEFSPIHDRGLPEDISGIYIGGGYPELHADELEANASMRASISSAISSGVPTVAECGGFMYLHERMEDADGVAHEMVGAVEGLSYRTGRLRRFGYIEMTCREPNLLAAPGDVLKAHEFHYWDSDDPGSAFHAVKPHSTREWDCVVATPTLYAGYPHLYFPGAPEAARRFVGACARRAAERHGAGCDGGAI